MKFDLRATVGRLRQLFRETSPPPSEMALRLQGVERDVILPVKGMFILLICYNFFFARWFENENLPQTDAQQGVEKFFYYIAFATSRWRSCSFWRRGFRGR